MCSTFLIYVLDFTRHCFNNNLIHCSLTKQSLVSPEHIKPLLNISKVSFKWKEKKIWNIFKVFFSLKNKQANHPEINQTAPPKPKHKISQKKKPPHILKKTHMKPTNATVYRVGMKSFHSIFKKASWISLNTGQAFVIKCLLCVFKHIVLLLSS